MLLMAASDDLMAASAKGERFCHFVILSFCHLVALLHCVVSAKARTHTHIHVALPAAPRYILG